MDQNFTFPHIPEWVPLLVRDASVAEPILAGRLRYGGALGLTIDLVQVPLVDQHGFPTDRFVLLDPADVVHHLGRRMPAEAAILWLAGRRVMISEWMEDGAHRTAPLENRITGAPGMLVIPRNGDPLDLRADNLVAPPDCRALPVLPEPEFRHGPLAVAYAIAFQKPGGDRDWPVVRVTIGPEIGTGAESPRVIGPLHCGSTVSANLHGALIKHALEQSQVRREDGPVKTR
jgi:hypothetical protein